MIGSLAWALLGLLLLVVGGGWLVRGASALAERFGLSPLAVGLTVVAFGTSAPELVVSVDAALSGAYDVSVGNVVGSNIANVALILGVATLIRPARVEAKVVSVDVPLMVATSVLLLVLLADGGLSRLEGGVLLVGLVAFTGFTLRIARRATAAPVVDPASGKADAGPVSARRGGVTAALVVGGLALLVGGGHLLVESAIALATGWGVSEAVIGLTVVAVGTSLPEFATSVVAAARGQGDIAVGNVVGSNVFNVLGILGLSSVIQPLRLGGVTWFDLGAMTVVACALGVFVFTRRCVGRTEGGLLLVAYVGYVAWLLSAGA